jgi:hypothetical protein
VAGGLQTYVMLCKTAVCSATCPKPGCLITTVHPGLTVVAVQAVLVAAHSAGMACAFLFPVSCAGKFLMLSTDAACAGQVNALHIEVTSICQRVWPTDCHLGWKPRLASNLIPKVDLCSSCSTVCQHKYSVVFLWTVYCAERTRQQRRRLLSCTCVTGATCGSLVGFDDNDTALDKSHA